MRILVLAVALMALAGCGRAITGPKVETYEIDCYDRSSLVYETTVNSVAEIPASMVGLVVDIPRGQDVTP